MQNKITELEMLQYLRQHDAVLPPLRVNVVAPPDGPKRADARVEISLPETDKTYQFILEAKSSSTARTVRDAIDQVRRATHRDRGEYPMVMVPYLSEENLNLLEKHQVSGVDLCGNGIVWIPGELYVFRTGRPNKYPESRPLINPYAGRSALVGRLLIEKPKWGNLRELTAGIHLRNGSLSYPQVAKAIWAMEEDLVVKRTAGAVKLMQPAQLLDRLGRAWKGNHYSRRQAVKLPQGLEWPQVLSGQAKLQWAINGESSAGHYTLFSQGGPLQVAVADLNLAMEVLHAQPERITNFADMELLETDEPGCYFATSTDSEGVRWASRVQTWLELQAGDGRQRDAAKDMRRQILRKVEE